MDADEEHNDYNEDALRTGGDDCACDRHDCLACVQLGSAMWARMYHDAEGSYRREQARRLNLEKGLDFALRALTKLLES